MVVEEAEAPTIVNNEVLLAIEKLAGELLQKFEGRELSASDSKQPVS